MLLKSRYWKIQHLIILKLKILKINFSNIERYKSAIIKVDRHNIEQLKQLQDEKRKRIAQETMEIYAPLADRMGMHRIRDELEDLSFEVLNHEARSLIQKRLEEIKLHKRYL